MARGERPTLTERRAEELRVAIAHKAKEIFVADGDTSATVERIAEAAGVSPRTFHRHFPVKEDVVRPLFRATSEWVADSLKNVADTEDLVEALVAAWTSAMPGGRLSEADQRFLELMVTTPQYRLRWQEADQELCEVVADFLDRRLPVGAHPLHRTLPAYLVVHATRHVFEHWITSGCHEDLTGLLRDALRMVLAGAAVR
ncbi:TetR family transcriptional regulator [Lentzea sp. NEAU-D13]|uniref:TetR family transcriptional regulator n=1 Tax=Lentzea alba TaxID=2714351 RepID=A0A7C9W5S5_9PSEU|nr:TetR/AcrR family transcriptional regulator [Lentzea alba]NGY65297.1 TetR family transcriptional regulator [Lentzea alba]